MTKGVTFATDSRFIPAVGVTLWFVTLGSSLLVNLYCDHDRGGIAWPYISDTAKYSPERGIFSFGATVVSMFMTLSCILQYGKVKHDIETREEGHSFGQRARKRNIASALCGIIGSPFLGLLASFDTRESPNLHLTCVLIFFPLMLIWLYVTTSVYSVLLKYKQAVGQPDPWLVTSVKLKKTISMLMTIFVTLYLPVGMYLVSDWIRYENDREIHTGRAVMQHLSVACLVSYFGTFWYDFGALNMKVVQLLPGERVWDDVPSAKKKE